MRPGEIEWEAYDFLLGTMTDKNLAKMIGCARNSVVYRRVKLKIPPYGKVVALDTEALSLRVPKETADLFRELAKVNGMKYRKYFIHLVHSQARKYPVPPRLTGGKNHGKA